MLGGVSDGVGTKGVVTGLSTWIPRVTSPRRSCLAASGFNSSAASSSSSWRGNHASHVVPQATAWITRQSLDAAGYDAKTSLKTAGDTFPHPDEHSFRVSAGADLVQRVHLSLIGPIAVVRLEHTHIRILGDHEPVVLLRHFVLFDVQRHQAQCPPTPRPPHAESPPAASAGARKEQVWGMEGKGWLKVQWGEDEQERRVNTPHAHPA